MRITRFRLFLLGGASLLLIGPAISLGQPGGFPGGPPGGFPGGGPPGGPGMGPGGPPGGPGGFQGGGGRRGGGGFRMDPNMIFNMLAKNQDTLSVADYLANPFVQRDPTAKDKVDSFMQRNGITNGQLTRDQFAQMFQERMAERQAQRAAQQGTDASQTPGAAATDPNADPEAAEVVPEKRPTVYRANNLPTQGLPPWFAQLDTDKDGQVGLYEWKSAGRSLTEFQTWDLNGDGFITVEEAMHAFKATQGTAVAAGGPQGPGSPSFGPQQQGGPPQGFQSGNNGGGRQRRNRGNWQNQNRGN